MASSNRATPARFKNQMASDLSSDIIPSFRLVSITLSIDMIYFPLSGFQSRDFWIIISTARNPASSAIFGNNLWETTPTKTLAN